MGGCEFCVSRRIGGAHIVSEYSGEMGIVRSYAAVRWSILAAICTGVGREATVLFHVHVKPLRKHHRAGYEQDNHYACDNDRNGQQPHTSNG